METRTTVDTGAARRLASGACEGWPTTNNDTITVHRVQVALVALADDLDATRAALDVSDQARRAHLFELENAQAERDAARAELAAIRAHCYGPGNESAMDQMLARAKAAEAVVEGLRNELDIIANATPSQWDPDMRDQFQAWVQNRARHAAGLTPPTA